MAERCIPGGRLPCCCSKCKPRMDSGGLFPPVTYINLLISFVTTSYRALVNNDAPALAFIVAVFTCFFALDMCTYAFNRLPPDEKSHKKTLLTFSVWFLSSATLFAFAYQFSTFSSTGMSIMFYSMASVTSAALFFIHFLLDGILRRSTKQSRRSSGASDGQGKKLLGRSNYEAV